MRSIARQVVLLARRLRESGYPVGPGEVVDALAALERVGLGDRATVKAALRCTLVRQPEAFALFDRLFEELFAGEPSEAVPRGEPWKLPVSQAGLSRAAGWPPAAAPSSVERELALDTRFAYSPHPARRRVTWPSGDPAEAAAYRRLAARVAQALSQTPSRRFVAARRGSRVDLRATVRAAWRAGGEPLPLHFRRRKEDPGRLVVLCDVSGSMEAHGPMLLRFIHALARLLPRRVEAFAFSTSYLRLTPFLRDSHVDLALRRAIAAASDWGGGTRIGASLEAWCRDYGALLDGRRVTLLVFSDGLDRGEPDRLRRAMARLRRGCRRILWLNPLAGDPGYRPLAQGMQAALPFINALVPAHQLSALAALPRYLGGWPSRRAGRRQGGPEAEQKWLGDG